MTYEIKPSDIRDYMKSLGWILNDDGVPDRLYVMTHADIPRRQLVFPIDTNAMDYLESVYRIIGKLSDIYNKDISIIRSDIIGARDEVIRLSVEIDGGRNEYLPISYISSAISGSQSMLSSSACTVLNPQPHHQRLSRAEAIQLIEHTNFGHTERGSFVLKISCPVNALDVKSPLLPLDDKHYPFVRRAMLTLSRGVRQIVNAIEMDDAVGLINSVKDGRSPFVSANLCESLTKFYDDGRNKSLKISFTLSPFVPIPQHEDLRPVRIQSEYFDRIEEIRSELRSIEGSREDTFVGTVERLDGDLGDDGRRAGDVILALLMREGESVRVRTTLSADDYATADRAHMSGGAYVRVTGTLHPGRQPRLLTSASHFELIAGL